VAAHPGIAHPGIAHGETARPEIARPEIARPEIARAEIAAWRPAVPGIAEVFHAHFTDHEYPPHTHDAWTLLIVDDGAVRYDLDHHEHRAPRSLVTLLPPHVPHNGRAASPYGFRKRVLYLDPSLLDEDLIGAAVDQPGLHDPTLRHRIHQLHGCLAQPGEELQAQTRLAFIRERLHQHLLGRVAASVPRREPGLADRLRDLLDLRTPQGVTLEEASRLLSAHPTHLVRAFTREHGMPPHLYLTGRRVDLARRLLLDGRPPAEVATAAGFYDQSHLTRHFKRMLGTSPARFANEPRA
jgi:AraC-like DNA-binding protein